MRANRRVNTGPERRLRSALHAMGVRFFKDRRVVAGEVSTQVDIVLPRSRLAIFVDGCFWHRCPEHSTYPKANATFWRDKLDRNVERDAQVNDALRSAGWCVLRVWEHEDPVVAAARIVEMIQFHSQPERV
jgi:DNA mismatch endonuclease, patch repair protein